MGVAADVAGGAFVAGGGDGVGVFFFFDFHETHCGGGVEGCGGVMEWGRVVDKCRIGTGGGVKRWREKGREKGIREMRKVQRGLYLHVAHIDVGGLVVTGVRLD